MMNSDNFARFLHNIGHSVRREGGVYWYNVHPHVYTSFPFHRTVNPEEIKMNSILKCDGWILRFPCAVEYGRSSYRIICDDSNYDLSKLSTKARNQTRRGLEQCKVEQISFDELLRKGLSLNNQTLARQGRPIPKHHVEYWERFCNQAGIVEGAEAWGAFIDKYLAAFLFAFRMDDCVNILTVRSATEYLKYYPNNALLFSYIHSTLGKGSVREVSIGVESIQSDMAPLDHFKYGLGFRKVLIGQRVEFASWLRPFMRGPILKKLTRFAESRSERQRFSKLAGLLRWYQEQPKISLSHL